MSIDNATPEEWDRAARAAQTAAKWAETGFNLETLNAHLARPFGEVSLADRCLAFALWQQGHPVQAQTDEFDAVGRAARWVNCTNPQWTETRRYRILAKPEELVLPSIDWSHVAPNLNALAQDKGGAAYLYEGHPSVGDDQWVPSGNVCVRSVMAHASFKPGRGDWRKMIVQRPEGA